MIFLTSVLCLYSFLFHLILLRHVSCQIDCGLQVLPFCHKPNSLTSGSLFSQPDDDWLSAQWHAVFIRVETTNYFPYYYPGEFFLYYLINCLIHELSGNITISKSPWWLYWMLVFAKKQSRNKLRSIYYPLRQINVKICCFCKAGTYNFLGIFASEVLELIC